MQTTLKIATVLSWFNMIVWGFIAGIFALGALFNRNFPLLIAAFLMGVTVLHSYAAMQLHKSLRNPQLPLSTQTPIGIRFIGFIAMFFGILFLGDGLTALLKIKLVLDSMKGQIPPEYKNVDMAAYVKAAGVFLVVSGTCIAVNVILNFRLLGWYMFSKIDAGK